ncbi:MAG: GldG family protein [Thermoanaerobaculia bacterium]
MTTARAARAGASAAAVALGAALVVGVNYLGTRHYARGDWTRARLYSLSATTEKVVKDLQKPLRVTVFMTRSSRLFGPVRELLSRYRALSPNIQVEELDPERNPARAEALVKEFGVKQSTVVFRSGDKKKYVEEDKLAEFDYSAAGMGGAPEVKAFKGEEQFTAAILAVTEDQVTKIYFTGGHGEPSIDSRERGRGFADVRQLLERDNLTVSTWNSLGKADLPADAGAIVVAGPRIGWLVPETEALEKYLSGGGRVLVLADPVLPGAGAPPSDYGLGKLLSDRGVRLGADIVVDPANAVPMVGPETLIANRYGSHPVVRALSGEGLPTVFPLARSVQKTEPVPAAFSFTSLVETTAGGWGETSLGKLENEGAVKDDKDTKGPVTIVAAVAPADEKKAGEKPAKLVVAGNSRFVANGSLANAGNANLFLNAIHWLVGQEKLVGIAPKTPEQASLALTQAQVSRISLFAILGMPAIAIALGVWVWYRRRD